MSFLKPLFADKVVEDDREPVTTFSIPGQDGRYGLLLPKIEFWYQLTYLLILDMCIMVVFGAMIYKFVIEKRGTTFSFLAGYGIIIPLALQIPYQLLELLELENVCLKMSVGTIPTVIFFRCTAAMHNTSLPVVESSMGNFLWYCSSMVPYVWDEKTLMRIKVTPSEFLTNTWRVVSQYVMQSLLLSYLEPYDFQPFESNVVLEHFHLNLDLFKPGQLINNYLLAWATFFTLSFGFNLVGFSQNLQGYKTPQIFKNPMLTATSPSDFWSRRWNSLIQTQLKHGVFRPARQFVPTAVALLLTFISSGLLHDYNWTVMFYHRKEVFDQDGNCNHCFFPLVFKQTAFFLWNGAIMLLEAPLAQLSIFQWASKHLPRPVIATMLCVVVVPVAHWFAGDWVKGGLFTHYQIGLLRIVRLE